MTWSIFYIAWQNVFNSEGKTEKYQNLQCNLRGSEALDISVKGQ